MEWSHNLFVIIQIGYNYRSIHEIPNLLRTFFVAGISILTSFFTERSKKIYITYLLGLAIIGSSQIFATWRYLPYTNYLTYALKGEFPSYSFRSAYNPNNSPYKSTNKGSKK